MGHFGPSRNGQIALTNQTNGRTKLAPGTPNRTAFPRVCLVEYQWDDEEGGGKEDTWAKKKWIRCLFTYTPIIHYYGVHCHDNVYNVSDQNCFLRPVRDAKPEQFRKEPSVSMVINSINATLFNHGNVRAVKDLRIWDSINVLIEFEHTDVYSYNPEADSDPNDEEGGTL